MRAQYKRVPMGDIDEKASRSVSEEEMLYDGVIQGDAELLYIDCYLSELFRGELRVNF